MYIKSCKQIYLMLISIISWARTLIIPDYLFSQGPECDEEAESELTVTELRERARKQREALEKRMMGDGSDEEEEKEESESSVTRKSSSEDIGCSWGMGNKDNRWSYL